MHSMYPHFSTPHHFFADDSQVKEVRINKEEIITNLEGKIEWLRDSEMTVNDTNQSEDWLDLNFSQLFNVRGTKVRTFRAYFLLVILNLYCK